MTVFGIYGAGGCGRGILPLVRTELAPDDEVLFVDDGRVGERINGTRVLGLAEFANLRQDKAICLAIASHAIRRSLDARCRELGLDFFSPCGAPHVRMDAWSIEEGALISPFTTIASNVSIGRHFHLNLYSYVEHDCEIGDFVTFAPAVRCNGNVRIGDDVYVGSNAVIRQDIRIGKGAVIGMGAVVTKDVPPGETWVGNPARPLIDRRPTLPGQSTE